MTILFDNITDIAGASEKAPITFWVPQLRENDSGDGIITTPGVPVYAKDGVFTSPDLDAGPAIVQIGLQQYTITIPESATPIRLWPLIDAGMPPPPESDRYQFVRNGGGVERTQAMTLADFNALASPDPATLYIIVEETAVL